MRCDRSPEVASDDRPLFAGDQVLFGRHLAGLLSLDELGNGAGAGGGVVAGLVFSAVGWTGARAGAEQRGHLDALPRSVQSARLVAKCFAVGARPYARAALLPSGALCPLAVRTSSLRRGGTRRALRLPIASRLPLSALSLLAGSGSLLQAPDVASKLVGRHAARATALDLVAEVRQRLALLGITAAAQRLSRLSLAVG
jgi:hypothetical protein